MLNTREIATVIWLVIFIIWALFQAPVRVAFLNLLRALSAIKIIVPLICLFTYITLMVIAFDKVGFWDISAIKDTIFWTFGTAFVIFVNLNKAIHNENYFKEVVLDNIKMISIFEFVENLYTFSIAIELILVPSICLLVACNTLAKLIPEYKKVNVLLNFVLGMIGFVIIFFTVKEIIVDYQNFTTWKNLRDFLLPLVLTVAILPFMFMMELLMQYEMLFVRLNINNINSDLAKYAKRRFFITCGINLHINLKLFI